MHGLQIHSSKNFYDLFHVIFEDVSGFKWVFSRDSFLLPLELEEASEYDPDTDSYISGPAFEFFNEIKTIDPQQYDWNYSNVDILKKFAKGVNEDWNKIFGTSNPYFDQKEWGLQYWKVHDKSKHVEENLEIVFLNIDAAYWEVYARDTHLLEKVSEHLKTIETDKVIPCILRNSHGI